MNIIIIYFAFFFICFNISGLGTTNILRLTSGNTMPVLASKCYCDNCGKAISSFYQLPIISYVLCKGKCKNCKIKLPVYALMLELILLTGMFFVLVIFDFSVIGVTCSFIYYEIVRVITVIIKQKRENGFLKQYFIAVLAMVPFYLMTLFVSLIYSLALCG